MALGARGIPKGEENVDWSRTSLGLTQIELGLISKVGRFKICMFENGHGMLSDDEVARIMVALKAKADRLRGSLPELRFSLERASGR